MNLLEAITFLRNNVLDDVGGLDADWESFSETDSDSLQLRWNNEALASNIQEAVTQVYRRILPVKDSDALFDITSVIGQREYFLNPKILQIQAVKDSTTGKELRRVDIEDVWGDRYLETDLGEPKCYIPNYDTGTISLYQIPDKVRLYKFLVYRLPLEKISWKSKRAEIELREEFIVPMLNYAAYLCYMLDEANVLDPSRANQFLAKFNQEFTITSAYSDVRKRRTSHRAIRYGGL